MSVSLTNNIVTQNSPLEPESSQRWRIQLLNTCPSISINETDLTERNSIPGNTKIVEYEDTHLDIKVFPNPANDILFVNLENLQDKVVGASIYNMLGIRVLTFTPVSTQSSTLSFNLENLPEGLYTVCIETAADPVCQKFVKIR